MERKDGGNMKMTTLLRWGMWKEDWQDEKKKPKMTIENAFRWRRRRRERKKTEEKKNIGERVRRSKTVL